MSKVQLDLPTKKPRKFLPEDFVISSWETIRPYFVELKDRTISSPSELLKWLSDRSELSSVLQEDGGWRYIRMSCDTMDPEYKKNYNLYITEIEPHIIPFENELNLKLLNSPFLSSLGDQYRIYLRKIATEVEIYREKNIPLFTKLQTEEQKYAELIGAMTINVQGEEMTLPRAGNLLKDQDRSLRKEVFSKIAERRRKDFKELDQLYSDLINVREEISKNAGFNNYRDYIFTELGRFDYTSQDCFDFHDSIASEIVPLVEDIERNRKMSLKTDALKPWDTEVDVSGMPALKPFSDVDELMDKTIQCFYKIDPFLGEYMEILKAMKHVDLGSRKGKAPGGYNFSLHEIGVPFIFMNATNSLRDLVTMVHEGGHAVHSFLTRDLEFMGLKSTPSEVAELASMSMELISMEYWDVFFENENDLKRAKRQHLEKIISILPWIATVDKFQHWVYTHPHHTSAERKENWGNIFKEFSGAVVDWAGHEDVFNSAWQKQLHLFQLPFYYIEYGMAQLGAIAVWRNYKQNPHKALDQYLEALKLGNTKTIGEIYRAAGVKFDFSRENVKELMEFVKFELDRI
jgi:oligoendopeptidase F